VHFDSAFEVDVASSPFGVKSRLAVGEVPWTCRFWLPVLFVFTDGVHDHTALEATVAGWLCSSKSIEPVARRHGRRLRL